MVGDDEVLIAVAVDVERRDVVRTLAGGEAVHGGVGAVVAPVQDVDLVEIRERDGDLESRLAVDVGQRDAPDRRVDEPACREARAPAAVVDLKGLVARRGDVEVAVAVEVAERDVEDLAGDRAGRLGGREVPVAQAARDPDAAAAPVTRSSCPSPSKSPAATA